MNEYLSEQIRFRYLTYQDKPALFDYFTNVQKKKLIIPPIITDLHQFVEGWINLQMDRYDYNQSGLYGAELKGSGELIGQGGLVRQFVDGIPKWQIDWHLFNSHNSPFNTSAIMQACIEYGFSNEMAETLISIIKPDDQNSKTEAGRVSMNYWKSTTFKNIPCEIYRIRREDWITS